jgi:hypothetical protein
MHVGVPPVAIVLTTLFRFGSMRETVPSVAFDDQAEPNPKVTSHGARPTRICLATFSDRGLTRAIVFDP